MDVPDLGLEGRIEVCQLEKREEQSREATAHAEAEPGPFTGAPPSLGRG